MRKSFWKKSVGMILAAGLFLGVCQPAGEVGAAEDTTLNKPLLAHYEFKDGGKDSSGNGNDATIGTGVTVKDGFASLPGGDADGTGFITLPEGMFDGQDTLTIAMWLRDNDPQDEWMSAFFIGSKGAGSNNYPTYYYYFNPCEKDHNTMKSVMTNGKNESKPMDTEKGLRNSISTQEYRGEWAHYAIVLQPGSMTCYINGEEVGKEEGYSMNISDFGTGLQSYIGKSNYPDALYQGDFKDFRVYADALDESQIGQLVGSQETPYSMTIDGKNVTKELSPNLYGLFYEDINSAADGGLYPEMVKNYSFENARIQKGSNSSEYKKNGYETIGEYKKHWTAVSGSFEVKDSQSLNAKNPHYAAITGNAVLENGGFAPIADPNRAAMAVKPLDTEKKTGEYTFSVFARADAGYGGTLKVKLADANGKAITDEAEIPLEADGDWKKLSAELVSTVTKNTLGKLVLTVEGADAGETLCLDMVSVVPHDSYGYGDQNYAYGVGIRQDLLDLMTGLQPKFMRFPGGCIVEGFNWEGLYDWRDSIGPLEERKSCTNRWENFSNNSHNWGYMQSFGFGYHELLSLCEDFDMEPFPVMSAGVLCQYETKDVDAKTGEELQFFIDMATNLLDYCWGDASKNEWAAKRKENGRPEPFNLKYLGIGNENFQAKYFNNFDVIKEAVEDYAQANYPGHELHIISSAGPTSRGNDLEYAYDRLAQTMPGETLVDEHYYESESFMYNQSDRYDYYQRTDQGGSDVFVGEYAIRNHNRYNTALAEACYITGLERNADVVKNISYAPMLYKVGNQNWDHNMIYFDEFSTARSTNYFVQKMFSNNYGTKLIGTELNAAGKDYSNYGSPILGAYAAGGTIDKVTVYGENGEKLFEDDFSDAAKGWEAFGGSADNFTISGGKIQFTSTDGLNAVYLPMAVEEKWKNYRIEVEGVTKTGGSGGMLVGAGYDRQYYWYHLDGNNGAYMKVTRPERGKTDLATKTLGNNYANKHYNTGDRTAIASNDPMQVAFNFGADGKLEAHYTSNTVSALKTAKYDFSSMFHQYQTDIYQVVNMDEKHVYIKLVNPDRRKKSIQLNFANLNLASEAEVTMLTGDLNQGNDIGSEVIVPTTSTQSVQGNAMLYQLPSYSVNVIRIPLAKENPNPEPPKADKSKLTAAIRDASSKVESAYTADSWKKLQTSLNAAKIVEANDAASQEQVDAATANLNQAIKGLVAAVKLQAPASVKAVWAGKKSVKVTWKKAAQAAQYEVYRSYKKTSGFKKLATVTGLSYTDKKATPGKTAYYKVIAANGAQKSAYSSVSSAYLLKAPAGVKAKASKRNVTVSCGKVKKATRYEIYRATKKNGKYKKVATVKSSKAVKKTFKNLKKGTYYFKLKALQKIGKKNVATDFSKAVRVKVK